MVRRPWLVWFWQAGLILALSGCQWGGQAEIRTNASVGKSVATAVFPRPAREVHDATLRAILDTSGMTLRAVDARSLAVTAGRGTDRLHGTIRSRGSNQTELTIVYLPVSASNEDAIFARAIVETVCDLLGVSCRS